MKVPFNKPSLAGSELAFIRDAVKRGHLSGDGRYSALCSRLLERAVGRGTVLTTSSCTHALELAALALDVRPGDEVAMPSFTFPSTANAFVLRGAVPRFVDVRPDTLNIDERLLAAACGPKTRGICPVHYAGVPCEMDEIMKIARRRGLWVVEDAAQALGAAYKGRPAGSFGDFAAFSFHETKNSTCGEGGALAIRSAPAAARAKIIRQKGTNRDQFLNGQVDKYSWVDVGSSYLMSDLQAAYLYAQLRRSRPVLARRRAIHERYARALEPLARSGRLILPTIPPRARSSYHLFRVVFETAGEMRAVADGLRRRGILAVTHFFPLHLSRMGRRYGYRPGDLPVTESIAPRLLRLPMYNDMTPAEQGLVIGALKDLLERRPGR